MKFRPGPALVTLPVDVIPKRYRSGPTPYRFYSLAEMGWHPPREMPPVFLIGYDRKGKVNRIVRLQEHAGYRPGGDHRRAGQHDGLDGASGGADGAAEHAADDHDSAGGDADQ